VLALLVFRRLLRDVDDHSASAAAEAAFGAILCVMIHLHCVLILDIVGAGGSPELRLGLMRADVVIAVTLLFVILPAGIIAASSRNMWTRAALADCSPGHASGGCVFPLTSQAGPASVGPAWLLAQLVGRASF